jgi:hypothetical protein
VRGTYPLRVLSQTPCPNSFTDDAAVGIVDDKYATAPKFAASSDWIRVARIKIECAVVRILAEIAAVDCGSARTPFVTGRAHAKRLA